MMAAMLTIGDPAPPFTLRDQDGAAVSLEDLRGSWVLLWWYPKAATPG
jgi:peroxiredoxin Q/BCP